MIRLLRTIGLATLLLLPAVVDAGPAIDPRQMSGIPRPDPQVPSGTVTVRVLHGSFDKPAVDTEVTLEIESASGEKTTQTAKSDGQGRVGFSGLEPGGKAIAKVELDGESLASQPIELRSDTGTRVMLVAGAGAAAGARPAHGQTGGPAVPQPGTAFPLQGTPAGELVVGTFDLEQKKPIEKVEVTLVIERPDGTKEERKATTDAGGKVVFEDLGAPTLPEGTKFTVSGKLEPDAEVQVSQPFEMKGSSGLAVVLAKGELREEPAPPQAERQGPGPVPPPTMDPSITPGTVRVLVVDGRNAPVADQAVVVVKKDMTGTDTPFPATTDAQGFAEVAVDVSADALYFVEARFDGAPYQSQFFQCDERGGVVVALRVYATTSDPSVVRSAVQFDIDGLENDLARVVQIYEVAVMGDKAFWPGKDFKIEPAEGGKGLVVPEFAEEYVSHQDKAQRWATLANPIPPGKTVHLSIFYLLEHDGTAAIEWTPPFELVEASVLVGTDQTLKASGAKPGEHPSRVPNKTVQLLGTRKRGEVVEFSIGGLPIRDPTPRRVALWTALAIGLAAAIGVLSRPRSDLRVRLKARRDALLGQLDGMPEGEARKKIVTALDRVYRQLEALDRSAAKTATPPKPEA